MKLQFNAPAHHTLLPDGPEGEVVYGGQPFDVEDEERAIELLTDPALNVTEAPSEVNELARLKRAELEELARQAGVSDPESLSNKDAVIAAITEAEADDGEGPDDDTPTTSEEE